IEALAKRLDALRNEVGDESLAGHTQRTQILEREPVVTSLLARTLFQVGRDLGPPQLVEAPGGAPEISRRVDRRVIGAHQGYDIADERRVRAREALFDSGKSEIYRSVEQSDRAARRAHTCHRCREGIYGFFRASRGMKPNLSRLASDDRNIARDVDPLRDQPCHLEPPLPRERPRRFSRDATKTRAQLETPCRIRDGLQYR